MIFVVFLTLFKHIMDNKLTLNMPVPLPFQSIIYNHLTLCNYKESMVKGKLADRRINMQPISKIQFICNSV